MWRKISMHPFWIRLTSWEYWPVYITNIPVFFIYLSFALRARDLFFFSSVNPAISTGGFFGEEKHKIYALIPRKYLPGTIWVERPGDAVQRVKDSEVHFPLICKPDIGERGMRVHIIEDLAALERYARSAPGGFIIQEYIDLPVELSVMCYRFPDGGSRAVTSVCSKVFLHVTGDGVRSIAQLIESYPRAILQKKKLAQNTDLERVPLKDETVLLEPIGNHCRGTQFVNANDLIDDALTRQLTGILEQMDGVYYGRFDLRTASIGALRTGREFLIMEFNGVGGEPAHIYDSGYPVRLAYRDIWRHWRIIYEIARAQRRNGVKTMGLRQGLGALRSYFSYRRKAAVALHS